MMQKLWQEKLKLKYSKEVFDIVQFGSSAIEGKEARDIDVAVIFNNLPLKKQIDEAYSLKKQLEKLTDKEIHISNYDLYSLFDANNFAREGIIFYGKSLISGHDFIGKFGLKPIIQISYSLLKLKKKDKVRFHYMLRGRKGKYGLLRKYGGKLIHPGLIEIAPEHENIFANSIKEIASEFVAKKILIEKL